MKRLGREYEKLEALNLFSLLPVDHELAIRDQSRKTSFLAQIDAGLDRALKSESTLHGIRVQTMFQLMVANFDKVRLIKQEDAGECYYGSDERLQVPDFKVVTAHGQLLLIETKNHYRTDPLTPFSMREADLHALSGYSSLLHIPLKFAVYWANWNTWTLNDPSVLKCDGQRARMDFGEAISASEMADLGDFMIGTKYPLVLRIPAATDKPRSISPEGEVQISTAGLEFYCAGERLEDDLEKSIAFYLMMCGKWEMSSPGAGLDEDGRPTGILYTFDPSEIHSGQGFEIMALRRNVTGPKRA